MFPVDSGCMNVGELRKAIARLPDDMPVVIEDSEAPWGEDVGLYVAPAHRSGIVCPWISEGHLNPTTDWARRVYGGFENIHVLLLTTFGGHDDCVDLTPEGRPAMTDGEVIQRAIAP